MWREETVEELSDGRFYTANDMVKIGTDDCRGCSDCCRMGPVIVLDPLDVFELNRFLGQSFEEMLNETIELKVIDALIGLRVPAQIEIDGLDIHEHGLASAYSGFAISDVSNMVMDVNENTDLGEGEYGKATPAQVGAAVKVVDGTAGAFAEAQDAGAAAVSRPAGGTGMYRLSIICRLNKFDELKKALNDLGVTGMTMTQVMGCGIQKGSTERYRGAVVDSTLLPKVKVEVVVSKIPVDRVIDAAKKALYTGHIGDGKIFVYEVLHVVKVRTGEEDLAALQDVE